MLSMVFINNLFSVTLLGQGQGPARQAAVNAGIPSLVPAYGVNMLCGSGLKAVALGYQAVLNDDSAVIVAGGQESMSQVSVCIFCYIIFISLLKTKILILLTFLHSTTFCLGEVGEVCFKV